MKCFISTGIALALCGAASLYAQDNGGYVDDRYYNASQAEEDASSSQRAANKQRREAAQNNEGTEYYTSSGSQGVNYDGDAQSYNTTASQYDDSYIDYDDDSYTTRMRRFYYPMATSGYWGSVYSPYWYDPFWSDPFYGWGGWYRPGFSVGFGAGPYWNSCWGMSAWYGFGGFNYWGFPSYGYGWGGGFNGYGMGYGGYWNGYYAGMYDGGGYSPYRRNVNYGPRGTVGVRGPGSNSARLGNRGAGTGNRPSVNGMVNSGRVATGIRSVDGRGRAERPSVNNGRINLNNDGAGRSYNVDRSVNNGRSSVSQEQPARRGGFFNRGTSAPSRNADRGNMNTERSSRSFEGNAPSRSYTPSQNQAPSRSYSPAPSRSSSSFGGGSRGGGSFGGGGGSRGGGGRGR